MDPEETLRELREISERILTIRRAPVDEETMRIAELFSAMDDWLISGGFLPREWRI